MKCKAMIMRLKEKGYSDQYIADKCGLIRSTVTSIRVGAAKNPGEDRVEAIKKFYEMEIGATNNGNVQREARGTA
jgi:hypothetical protein